MKYIIAIIALVGFFPVTALAQSMYCQPADAMRIELNETYGETLKAGGTVSIPRQGVTLEIWNNPETGTWTALYVFAENGQACRVSNGAGMTWPVM